MLEVYGFFDIFKDWILVYINVGLIFIVLNDEIYYYFEGGGGFR